MRSFEKPNSAHVYDPAVEIAPKGIEPHRVRHGGVVGARAGLKCAAPRACGDGVQRRRAQLATRLRMDFTSHATGALR
jgi:hypothetical protein